MQQRPQRTDLRVPLRYHVIGDTWYEGWTENISRTGVLVRAAQAPPLGAEVDVILTVPAGILGDLGGETFCAGAISRRLAEAAGESSRFAIVFRRCRPTAASRSS
jgi:hypothetical protein